MTRLHRISGARIALAIAVALAASPAILSAEDGTPAQLDAKPQGDRLSYKVQPGDLLEIFVWREKDLQRDVIVRPDGGLSFPLVGEIPVAGKTVTEIRTELVALLRDYVSNPTVSVSVKLAQGYKIYVVGKVNRPGEFTAIRPVDVVQALSMAGGLSPFAAANSIKILRRENGAESAIPFKYGQIESGRRLEQNIVLQSGDVVLVP